MTRSVISRNPKVVHYDHYSEVDMREWEWDDFTPGEIASRTVVNHRRGPKGPILIDFYSMDCLQNFRDEVGKSFIINSAYRSPDYNTFIKGATTSQHMKGKAFDISMHNHGDIEELAEVAREFGFNGIGYYNTFLHVDTRESTAFWDNRS